MGKPSFADEQTAFSSTGVVAPPPGGDQQAYVTDYKRLGLPDPSHFDVLYRPPARWPHLGWVSGMKERPISYGPPMVRARRAGLKTQTRRVVKPQPSDRRFGSSSAPHMLALDDEGIELYLHSRVLHKAIRCPYGQPGDRLWVREAWRAVDLVDDCAPRELDAGCRVWYEADAPHQPGFGKYRPPMFMPRWASRGLDEIVSVRVERLQDISESDAISEGIEILHASSLGPERYLVPANGREPAAWVPQAKSAYRALWEQINGPGSWKANPWVWVIEFKVLTP